jgi:hypothetical protein
MTVTVTECKSLTVDATAANLKHAVSVTLKIETEGVRDCHALVKSPSYFCHHGQYLSCFGRRKVNALDHARSLRGVPVGNCRVLLGSDRPG